MHFRMRVPARRAVFDALDDGGFLVLVGPLRITTERSLDAAGARQTTMVTPFICYRHRELTVTQTVPKTIDSTCGNGTLSECVASISVLRRSFRIVDGGCTAQRNVYA